MKSIGFVHVFVGKPNCGKSKEILNKIERSKRWVFVYDHRQEYIERLSGAANRRTTVFYSLSKFREFIKDFKDSTVVMEEPVTYMNMTKEKDVIDELSGICHNGNILYLPFQTLDDIPKYVTRLTNFITIYETGDDVDLLDHNRPKLAKLYRSIKAFPQTFVLLKPGF